MLSPSTIVCRQGLRAARAVCAEDERSKIVKKSGYAACVEALLFGVAQGAPTVEIAAGVRHAAASLRFVECSAEGQVAAPDGHERRRGAVRGGVAGRVRERTSSAQLRDRARRDRRVAACLQWDNGDCPLNGDNVAETTCLWRAG